MMFVSFIIYTSIALSLGIRKALGFEMVNPEDSERVSKFPEIDIFSDRSSNGKGLWKRDSDDENDMVDDWEFWPARIFPVTPHDFDERESTAEITEPTNTPAIAENPQFERAYFANDRARINKFNETLNRAFPKLLLFLQDDPGFEAERGSLETDIIWLNMFYPCLVNEGNFFLSETTRPLEITRSLYRLLLYRHSLKEKHSEITLQKSEYEPIGEFHLNLVDFEIGLYEFLDKDTTFKDPTTREFEEILYKTRIRIVKLLGKFREVVPVNTVFFHTFKKQLRHFEAVYCAFDKIVHTLIFAPKKKFPAERNDEEGQSATVKPEALVRPVLIQDIYQGSFESMN